MVASLGASVGSITWSAPQTIIPLASTRLAHVFALPEAVAEATASRLVRQLSRSRSARVQTDAGPLAALRAPWRIPGLDASEWFVPLLGWSDDRALSDLGPLLAVASSGRRTRVALGSIECAALGDATPARTTTIFVRKRGPTPASAPVPGIEIRRSVRADAPAIRGFLEIALQRGFRQAESREPGPDVQRIIGGRLLRSALGADGISYVAVASGTVVGHASGQLFDEDDFGEGPFGALTDILSRPEFAGRGIGSQLEDAFVREAFERGASFIEGTVIPTDPERTRFLLGFVAERQWRIHRSLVLWR